MLQREAGVVDAYLAELERELAELSARWGRGPLRTVYLGGGTPTHLRDGELARVVDAVQANFDGWETAESTLEAHPSNVTPARARAWRAQGFRRVSVGVQSTSDAVLRRLGRPHDAAAGLRALDAVLDCDGWVCSADVITAVEGQDIEADLTNVAKTGVAHLSAYTLTIEPQTPFARRGVEVDAAAEADALRLAGSVLAAYGLHRYEVSNHARDGARCAHNLAYWQGGFWLAAGPSASAHEPGPHGARTQPAQRRTNPPLERWLRGERGEPEALSVEDVIREAVFTGLRLTEGVDLPNLRAWADPAGHGSLLDAVLAPVPSLQDRGLVEFGSSGNLRATADGLLVLDGVAAEFLATPTG